MAQNHRSLDDPDTLRQFVRRLDEGVYITAVSGEILDLNPAAVAMLGFRSLAEARRTRTTDLLARPAERQGELELLARDGVARSFELEVRRPDGEVRTLLDTCYAERDPDSGELLIHGILVDVTERKRLERELRDAAVRDALTGCFNRHHLETMRRRVETEDRRWGAILVDLDHLKRINDERGHAAGDRALIAMARFLMRHVRSSDQVVRVGGDEFVVLLPDIDRAEAVALVERIEGSRDDLAPVTFALGWAVREGDETLAQTIDRADHALLRGRARRRPARPDRRQG
jgi:diguanylate cyclase (GGDEF)-like protein/PAS domain S-box-containing protein